MSAASTLYEVLGVPSDASEQDIVYAYRTLIRRNHPDIVGPAGADATAQINEAFDVLRDPVSRREYDRAIPGASPGTTEESAPEPAPSWTPEPAPAAPRRNVRPPAPPRTFWQREFTSGSIARILFAAAALATAAGVLAISFALTAGSFTSPELEPFVGETDLLVAALGAAAALAYILTRGLGWRKAYLLFCIPGAVLLIGLLRVEFTWVGAIFTAAAVGLVFTSKALMSSWRKHARFTEGAILHDELYDVVHRFGRGPFFVKATDADIAIVEDLNDGTLRQIKGWGRAQVDTWVVLNTDDLIVYSAPWYVYEANAWREAREAKASRRETRKAAR
ncbi:J domain-containing protein [Agromyces sp. NPDC057679]|uniref:J domain-containing protein n=1 Tax=Agromyces sp. NPDC057679 TaxID=3346207 RepID=UPI00366F0E25